MENVTNIETTVEASNEENDCTAVEEVDGYIVKKVNIKIEAKGGSKDF